MQEQQFSPCRIRDASGCHHDGHEQAHRVHQNVPFPTAHLFACIIAMHSRSSGCLDTLAIQCASGRMCVSACLLSNASPKRVMDALPRSIITKRLKVGIHTWPLRIVRGKHSPLASRHYHRQDRIDHRSHTQRSRPSSRLGGRDQVFDTIPLNVSQVSWVDVVLFHSHCLPHLNG